MPRTDPYDHQYQTVAIELVEIKQNIAKALQHWHHDYFRTNYKTHTNDIRTIKIRYGQSDEFCAGNGCRCATKEENILLHETLRYAKMIYNKINTDTPDLRSVRGVNNSASPGPSGTTIVLCSGNGRSLAAVG